MFLTEFFNSPEGDSYANPTSKTKIAETKSHVSPSGVKTNMSPKDDDYAINYGAQGNVAKFRKDQNMDVKTGKSLDEDTTLADVIQARELANQAVRNPDSRHEYFNFLKFLRDKHGADYSTNVHQQAKKLQLTELDSREEDNFTADDIKELEGIRDIATLKARAKALVSKPSKRRMKQEKIQYFFNRIDALTSPTQIIKLMWDLLLSGEGQGVIGSRYSTNPNSYRQRFSEDENPVDTVKMDIPLFIRLLEYAREDAKTDMDLHNVTERAIALSQEGSALSMQDYNNIVVTKELNND